MAEFIFCVQAITPDLYNQCVDIRLSAEPDEDTVNEGNIFLMHTGDNNDKSIAPFDIEIDDRIIRLHLREWAVPNDRYVLIVQKGIKNLMGDMELETSILREVFFRSDVTSDVLILSPADYEEISGALNVKWEETARKLSDLVGSFYLEVARENAFYNVVCSTFISRTAAKKDKKGIYSIPLKEIADPGQYFVRVRSERKKNGDYGKWSNVATFVIKSTEEPVPSSPKGIETESQSSQNEEKKNDPEGPEIIDFSSEPTDYNDLLKYEKTYDEIPNGFSITFPGEIDITDAVITVERSDT